MNGMLMGHEWDIGPCQSILMKKMNMNMQMMIKKKNIIMTGWWFGCHFFPIYWESHHPN